MKKFPDFFKMGQIRVEYGASYAENASKNEKNRRLSGRRSQKKGRSCKKAAPAKAMYAFLERKAERKRGCGVIERGTRPRRFGGKHRA